MSVMLAAAMLVAATIGPGSVVQNDPEGAEVITELNRMRTDPAGYARSLRVYRQGFERDGITHRETPDAPAIPTLEGIAAVDEAIGVLELARPVLPFTPDPALAAAADDLSTYQGRTGEIGHIGPAGATPGQRVASHGGLPYGVAEVIAYGETTPEGIVRQLVVDGGVPGRPHRRILLNPYFRLAGARCGPHRLHRHVCVIDVAAGR